MGVYAEGSFMRMPALSDLLVSFSGVFISPDAIAFLYSRLGLIVLVISLAQPTA